MSTKPPPTRVLGRFQGQTRQQKSSFFNPYISFNEYRERVDRGDVIKGILHVNAKMPNDAFVRARGPYMQVADDDEFESFDEDVLVSGPFARNRAFHGDTVGVELLPKEQWKSLSTVDATGMDKPKPTGQVVFVERKEGEGSMKEHFVVLRSNRSAAENSRLALDEPEDYNPDLHVRWQTDIRIKAVPLDRRIPWLVVPISDISASEEYRNLLESDYLPEYFVFTVRMTTWKESVRLPEGRLVGRIGDLNTVTTAEIMAMNVSPGLVARHVEPFSNEVEQNALELIATEEVGRKQPGRVNLKHERVISIDPPTAKDLDDAIHIKQVCDQFGKHLEIGVHIADVSYFLPYGSLVDDEARERTTTVYLPHKAFHMLPRSLCQNVCSLNPGVDKLTFSCVFYLDFDGKLLEQKKPKFFRSLISTKYRLNYDEVQNILERHRPETVAKKDTLAPIVYLVPSVDVADSRLESPENPEYPVKDLTADLLLLEQVTQRLRTHRFENGAMELHKVQLRFVCSDDGLPLSVAVDPHNASHELIEELMLMANKLVARKIMNGYYGPWAVLRHHPPLDKKKLEKLMKQLEGLGLPSGNLVSSGGVHKLITEAYRKKGKRVAMAVEQLIIEAMQLARYGVHGTDGFHPYHFGLAFPEYTHFTSPIRRYPDILVHRLLDLTLKAEKGGLTQPFKRIRSGDLPELKALGLEFDALNRLLMLCNDKKEVAKKAGESAAESWLLMWLLTLPEPPITLGTVVEVNDKSLLVFVAEFDTKSRLEFGMVDWTSDRVKSKIHSKYRDQITLPSSYEVQEEMRTVRMRWPSGESQRVDLYGCVPVWCVPTKDTPMKVQVLALEPTHPRYKSMMVLEQRLTAVRNKFSE